VSREYSAYWTVTVKISGGGSKSYEKRFEFRGETAEADAQDCYRRAEAVGLQARITKAKAVQSSWEPELAGEA